MNYEVLVEFHKRFARGEQYLIISADGEIGERQKDFPWQERMVFNHIAPIIEALKTREPNLTDEKLYGKNGIVSKLIPAQRAYNDIKNRKHEFITRLSSGVFVVEEGSVDVEMLENEGLSAGKVITYRQGSTPPRLLDQENVLPELRKEEDRLLREMLFLSGWVPYPMGVYLS